ncbi:MAG: hypothetical protein AVDCRST_MAG14-2094, partial [uncultured Rubrobacteraceae bacterium]
GRVPDGLQVHQPRCQDHDDRPAHAGQGSLRRALLRHHLKELQEAGCKRIQVDEPWFTVIDRDEGGPSTRASRASLGCTVDRYL